MAGDAGPALADPLQLSEVEIVPSGPLHGVCRAPASKSVTNRLLLAAALAEGTSHLAGILRSDDTAVMMAALRSLGAAVRESDGSVEIGGLAGGSGGGIGRLARLRKADRVVERDDYRLAGSGGVRRGGARLRLSTCGKGRKQKEKKDRSRGQECVAALSYDATSTVFPSHTRSIQGRTGFYLK